MSRPRSETHDRFAELLSLGLTVAQASERMGISVNVGHRVLSDIRNMLGPQAR